jgi:glucose/mannose-6-phosphate isomerase
MKLDSASLYKKHDTQDLGAVLHLLPNQSLLAWQDTKEIKIDSWQKDVDHIVVVGMGGSALGAEMAVAICADELKLPVTIIRNDCLPAWINKRTLVILSSFSGNTYEVIKCADQAHKAKTHIVAVTSGGQLQKMAKSKGWPCYCFDPHDYAPEPRFGLGFSLFSILAMFNKLKICTTAEKDIDQSIQAMNEVVDMCAADIPTHENVAKQVAEALYEKNVLIVGASHLSGVAHAFANHCNETAKNSAFSSILPEMNHHFFESLAFPARHTKDVAVILINSNLYSKENIKRMNIAATMLEKDGVSVIEYIARGKTTLEENGEVLQFALYVAYYLAMRNGVDPATNHRVDEIKERLAL